MRFIREASSQSDSPETALGTNVTTNLLGYDRDALTGYFAELGEPSFRASQIMKWMHRRRETRFDEMTDLSKPLRRQLNETAVIRGLEAVSESISVDGTIKWLLRLDDGNCVETVFIPERTRGTLCVSSQVGCTLNCTFCATGRMGYNRNLTAAEIIAQVWHACSRLESTVSKRVVTNIVFMGMGEPFYNCDSMIPAIRLLLDDCSYGFGKRKVTVSTAGVIPGIKRLAEECKVSLAVSLHAPNDELRNELVPINRKYPIADLMKACRGYVASDRRSRVTFEYIMLKGINDSIWHARKLVRILQGVRAKVNLIPYNRVEGLSYERTAQDDIDIFRDILLNSRIMTITRKTRGHDVNAACGQLVGKFHDRTKRSARLAVQ